MDEICLDCNDAIDENPRNRQRWSNFKEDDIFYPRDNTWLEECMGKTHMSTAVGKGSERE
jgi:hypothetical protein